MLDSWKRAYDKSSVPIICLDENLDKLFCNDAARLYYRLFCMGDGIKDFLTKDEYNYIIEKLKTDDVVRVDSLANIALRAVTFARVYDKDGTPLFIKLQTEERSPLENTTQSLFNGADVKQILFNEYLRPITNINFVLDSWSDRIFSRNDIVDYNQTIRNNLFILTSYMHNIEQLIDCLQTGYKSGKRAFSIYDFMCDYAKDNGLRIISIDSPKDFFAFVDPDRLNTAMSGAVEFLLNKEGKSSRMQNLVLSLSEDAQDIYVDVSRTGVYAKLDPKSDIITNDEKSGIHLNLFNVSDILSQMDGTVTPLTGKNKLTVQLRIPKLFQGPGLFLSSGDMND